MKLALRSTLLTLTLGLAACGLDDATIAAGPGAEELDGMDQASQAVAAGTSDAQAGGYHRVQGQGPENLQLYSSGTLVAWTVVYCIKAPCPPVTWLGTCTPTAPSLTEK